MDALSRLLDGAVDLHVHSGPSLFPRRIDHVEAARLADSFRMRAIVVKSHHHTTAPEVAVLRKHLLRNLGVQVFGGVALNGCTGGLNPHVVDMTIRLGGRVVWFPTVSAEQHIRYQRSHNHSRFPTQAGRPLLEVPVPVVDERGQLLPQARQILGLVAEADVLMSPGHASPAEILALLNGAREAGVRKMIVNHPEFVVGASEAQVREFARLGAFIEHSICMYRPESTFYEWPMERLVQWIEVVGPEKTVLASDLGQRDNPFPTEALRRTIAQLLDLGVPDTAVTLMVKRNPAWLLGLED